MKISKKMQLMILFVSLLISCNERNTFKKLNIDEENSTIRLPSKYKIVEESNIGNVIYKEQDKIFQNEILSFIRNNPKDLILVDTINPYNFILISKIEPYIEIDSLSFELFISKQKNRFDSIRAASNSYIGSRMKILKRIKYIESKYIKHDSLNRQRIVYSFVVSGIKKTFGIGIYSPEEQNASKIIETIRLND